MSVLAPRPSYPRRASRLWVERLEDRTNPAFTMNFEGLGNLEPIAEYYNGGLGGNGSGPGPNFGVSFSGNALAITDADDGGSGNFGGEPSSPNIAFFLTGGGALTMNVPAGFDRGFSFYYAAINQPGFIRVYDGPNATGTVLATLSLPTTPFNGAPDPTGQFSPFVSRTVEFQGTAKSVDFGGTANQIGFDNITLGPLIELQDASKAKTDAVKVANLMAKADDKTILNADGTPTAKFNKNDSDRFFIVIDDKSIAAATVEVDRIQVTSLGRSGATLDSLAKLRLNRQADGRFISQPLILVADAQDDAFGGNEGTSDDLTIQAEAGGKLRIKYKDSAGLETEKVVPVTKPTNLRRIVVNAVFINGSGWTAGMAQGILERAGKYFSQADAYTEVKAVIGINDPGGLADLDEYQDPPPAGMPYMGTPGERQLLMLNRDSDVKVLNAYFVRSLSMGSIGEAFVPALFTEVADAAIRGSIVLSFNANANAKNTAHEIQHVLRNFGGHTMDQREVNVQGLIAENSLLKKRIQKSEVATLRASPYAQAVAAPSPIMDTAAAGDGTGVPTPKSRTATRPSAAADWTDAAALVPGEVVTPRPSPVRSGAPAVSGGTPPIERGRAAEVAVGPVPTGDAGAAVAADWWDDFAPIGADLSPWATENDR